MEATRVLQKTSLSDEELVDKIKGVIYGTAIGDGFGMSTEFMAKEQAATLYGNGPIKFGLDDGHDFWRDAHRNGWFENDFSDDTDQMLLILQGIIQNDGIVNPLHFAFRLHEWTKIGWPELQNKLPNGIGFTVMKSTTHEKFFSDPFRAAYEVWNKNKRNLAANGAIMRTGVSGVPHFWDENKVAENSMMMAKVTHADPRSVTSALIASVMISRMLRGISVDNSSSESLESLKDDLTKLVEAGSVDGERTFLEKFDALPKATPKGLNMPLHRTLLQKTRQFAAHVVGEPLHPLFENDFSIPRHPPIDLKRFENPAPIRANVTKMDEMGTDEEMMEMCKDVVAKYRFLVESNSLCGPPKEDEVDNSRPEIMVIFEKTNWAEELDEHCFPSSLSSLKLDERPKIGYSLKCLGSGLYTVTRKKPEEMSTPEFCKHLLTELALEVGDADTNCAVAGALLGCRVGKSGLPQEWVEGVRHKEFLENLANQLCQLVLESMKK